jgi:D-cysteine desulfhydrase
MIDLPERIPLANLPTRIEKLANLSRKLAGPEIYIKRDDYTGMEVSGNKVRKLEYSVKEALDRGCDSLITCGGVQSNHCRATAAVAARLGMKVCLVLSGDEKSEFDGNLFLDRLLGADVRFVSADDYASRRDRIMEQEADEMRRNGLNPYIIPVGASNGIGCLGYFTALQEIIGQEQEMNLHFDAIVTATGSGGTYAGLFLARTALNHDAKIYGISVGDSEAGCRSKIVKVMEEAAGYINIAPVYSIEEIHIIDRYVGMGYALSRKEELQFIHDFAGSEGIILDPVYTGKAMYGLVEEIRNGGFSDHRNVLFIHTGGIFDIFAYRKLFEATLWNKV